jgi:hypothetical protein
VSVDETEASVHWPGRRETSTFHFMVRREDLGDHRGASGNLFGEIINERNWRLTDVVAMYHLKFGKYGDHINEGMVSKWARGVVRPGPLRAVRLAELMTKMEGRMLSATDLFGP